MDQSENERLWQQIMELSADKMINRDEIYLMDLQEALEFLKKCKEEENDGTGIESGGKDG